MLRCKGSCPSAHPSCSPSPQGRGSRRLLGAAGPTPFPPVSLCSVGAWAVLRVCRPFQGSDRYWGIPARPEQLLSSPLLPFSLLEPAGEVVDAHVLELEQVLQAPHLHLQDLGGRAQVTPRDPLPSSPPGPKPPHLPGPHLHSLL